MVDGTDKPLRVLVIGGTGFIGVHAVTQLVERGHKATVLALDLPVEGLLPPSVEVTLGNLESLSDDEVSSLCSGHDALVFAAGVDDRTIPVAPAWEFFKRHNVDGTRRLFHLAARAGVRRGIVCGSYFAWFERENPDWKLAEHHPYIRSRREQAREALSASQYGMKVTILELPYIFGSVPGRRPLWAPLVKYLAGPMPLFYTRGGTNMVSVRTVAKAIAGAVEQPDAGDYVQVGDRNLTWREWLEPLSRTLGKPKRLRTLPTFLLVPVMALLALVHRFQGRESGLHPVHFLSLQSRETFFDPAPGRKLLGYEGGDLDEALRETLAACGHEVSGTSTPERLAP